MPYTPNNHPYIPGDPYSYDLKWLVRSQKESISKADLAATQAAQAISDAASALTAAGAAATAAANASNSAAQASAQAASANSAATQAAADAAAALAAAQASEFEIIDIQCDRTNHTATVQSSYTWDELYNLVAANKVLFRLKDSGFSSDMIPTPFRPHIQEGGSQPASLNSAVWVDGFYTAWSSGTPYNAVYIQRVWLMNGLTGTYYVGYADVTAI